ncbi:MAG TPA: CpsD/CapB family tyrosine-protein kinase [Vicinamibacterales bacterium]|nr:CpsD/CapB family tyrosine-protein kinase [Vicinamibacterales bacterium]
MRDRGRVLRDIDSLLAASHGLPVQPRPAVPRTGIAEQLVSLIAPGSFAADQYRTLRQSIERLRRDEGLHVLAMTSPTPGDGKTVTTLNLAGALAQAPDARILVVDADLRRPSVAKYLGLGVNASPGLSELLQDDAYGFEDVVRRFDGFNLSIVPAGVPQDAPYELLNSVRFETFLADVKERYDCVLIDTPPLVPLPDCRLIGKWVDGFLLVVGAHRTPRKLVTDALHLLDAAKVIGIVFNGDRRPLSDQYGYGHYYYTRPADRKTSWWQRLLTREGERS